MSTNSSTALTRPPRSEGWILAVAMSLVWVGWITFELYFFGPSPLIAIWYLPQAAGFVLLMRADLRHYLKGAGSLLLGQG